MIKGRYSNSFHSFTYIFRRDSSVGIALDYGLDARVSSIRFPAGAGNFSLHHRAQIGTHPPIQWVAFSLGVKRPGRETDHVSPSSAEVKNARSYASTPQYVFMARCLVKCRDKFTFTFYLHFSVI
jgi:hypothetical protein